MKKLTKLTALALALALVLGMTAFAGTTNVIKSVDFTGYTDLSAFTTISYNNNGTTTAYFKNGATYADDDFAADTLYYQTASSNPNWAYMAITTINGVNTVAPNKAMWHNGSQNPNQVAITFPEEWTTEKDTALVVEMKTIPDARNKTGDNSYSYQTIEKTTYAALLTETTDGVDSNVIRSLSGLGWSNEYTFLLYYNQEMMGNNSTASIGNMPKLQENKMVTVIRPFETDDVEEPESLQLITGANRMPISTTYHVAGKTPITGIRGMQYGFTNAELMGLTGYRLYEVSLDPADFAITSAKSFTDINITDDIKISFSQPVTTKVGSSTLENTLKITPDGGEALVYGEDYTISFAEKSDGTAIYDEMTITPVTGWAYDTTYTIGIPDGMMNIARVALADADAESKNADVITFETVAAPVFTMTLDAYKGLSATGTALTALEAGTTYFAVSATQSAGVTMTNGNVRIEILDAEGNVVKYATANKALSTSTAATFGAAFKLEAGQTAKAYVVGTKGVATK